MRQWCDTVVARVETLAKVVEVLVECQAGLARSAAASWIVDRTNPACTSFVIQNILCFKPLSHPNSHDLLLDSLPDTAVQSFGLALTLNCGIEQQLSLELLCELSRKLEIPLEA